MAFEVKISLPIVRSVQTPWSESGRIVNPKINNKLNAQAMLVRNLYNFAFLSTIRPPHMSVKELSVFIKLITY